MVWPRRAAFWARPVAVRAMNREPEPHYDESRHFAKQSAGRPDKRERTVVLFCRSRRRAALRDGMQQHPADKRVLASRCLRREWTEAASY